MKYRVWDCKIVVPADAELPKGFDLPPRCGAINAVLSHGIKVIACFSGWGGSLTESEENVIENKDIPRDPRIYEHD